MFRLWKTNRKVIRFQRAITCLDLTLTLQKSRKPQIQGAKGEAIVNYCEPLATQEMRYHRLSRRVNNRPIKAVCNDITRSDFLDKLQNPHNWLALLFILYSRRVIYATLGFILCLVSVGSAWAHADIESLPPSVAIMSYRHVLYLNPDDLTTRNRLAMALFRTNKLEEAKKELRYILGRDSRNFDALDGFGVVLIKMGKHKEALKYLNKAVSINGQDVMVHVHLSVVYEKMKLRKEARAELKKAQSLASPEELKKIEAERRLVSGR